MNDDTHFTLGKVLFDSPSGFLYLDGVFEVDTYKLLDADGNVVWTGDENDYKNLTANQVQLRKTYLQTVVDSGGEDPLKLVAVPTFTEHLDTDANVRSAKITRAQEMINKINETGEI